MSRAAIPPRSRPRARPGAPACSGLRPGRRSEADLDGNGTYFMNSSFSGVFTAENGRSTTLTFAGPQKQTSPSVIDAQAGTVTIVTTYGGLYEKFSITGGPTLSIDAGSATFVDVFEYT